MVSYQSIGADHLNTEANQELNLQAARESIVLLKVLEVTILPLIVFVHCSFQNSCFLAKDLKSNSLFCHPFQM